MRTSKFSESPVLGTLTESHAGVPVTDRLRWHGVSKGAFFKWRSKSAGALVAAGTALGNSAPPASTVCIRACSAHLYERRAARQDLPTRGPRPAVYARPDPVNPSSSPGSASAGCCASGCASSGGSRAMNSLAMPVAILAC